MTFTPEEIENLEIAAAKVSSKRAILSDIQREKSGTFEAQEAARLLDEAQKAHEQLTFQTNAAAAIRRGLAEAEEEKRRDAE